MDRNLHASLSSARRLTCVFAALLALGPVHSAVFTVTTTADTNGPSCASTCSLREAINAANNNPGADIVHFNIPGSGVRTIALASPLPQTSAPLVIDGYSQPGAAANTLGSGSNAVLLIRIDGSALPVASSPLVVSGGQSTLRGLSMVCPNGACMTFADVSGNADNAVEGVWAGLNADGTGVVSHVTSVVANGTSNTARLRIGGPAPAQRNVLRGGSIFGSPFGAIVATSASLRVVNNYFDTDKHGQTSFGAGNNGVIELPAGTIYGGAATTDGNISVNGVSVTGDGVTIENNRFGVGATGVALTSAASEFVRLSAAAATGHIVRNNIFGGNSSACGVRALSAAVSGTRIVGNWFGLAPDGTSPRSLRNGVCLATGVSGIVIGGPDVEDGNLISNSAEAGVLIDGVNGGVSMLGNDIGLNAAGGSAANLGGGIRLVNAASNITIGGAAAGEGNEIAFNSGVGISIVSGTGNRMLGNRIHGNSGVEVDLGNGSTLDGANVNDGLDADGGGNTRINHPTLQSAVRGGNQIQFSFGFVTAANQSDLRIEVFRSNGCDNTGGLGQAQRSIGHLTGVSSNGTGDVLAGVVLTDSNLTPAFYSAMLTDASGNTSEVSPCRAVPSSLLFIDGFGD